ncbi:MAG: prohibitin family protein [Tolypothrix carrinoi HA7290-LM1]|jgi:regulator of protease activity HflC (stomatin/prohibitin superfamily)|nr:prohibitin family protein [Tolypothrix carrinoi HA7290-LM1]
MESLRNNNTNNHHHALYLVGGIVLLVLAIIFRPFSIVNAGERGVVMQFGKVQDRVFDEGIHPITPIVTSVKNISIRIQNTSFKADATSKDLQKMTAEIAVNWNIDPTRVNKVYQKIGDEQQIITTIIAPAVSEVLKAAISQKSTEEVITERAEIKAELDTQLKNRLAPYGVIVDDVSIINFAFPEEFSKAVEARQIAEQQARLAEFNADKAAQEAQANINRAKGEAEAQKLQEKTLTPAFLQKQAIEKWDGKFPMVMTGDGKLPMINITTATSTNNATMSSQQKQK